MFLNLYECYEQRLECFVVKRVSVINLKPLISSFVFDFEQDFQQKIQTEEKQ